MNNFEKHKDPKEALQIGIFVKRSFKDDFEASKFIISNLKAIVKKDKNFSKSIGEKVEEYIIKYIFIEGSISMIVSWQADPSLVWLIRSELDKIDEELWDKTFVK